MAVKNLELLGQLEERCREQGVRLMYGELMGEGGLCRLRGERLIVINRRASSPTRARIISDALARLEAERAGPPSIDVIPAAAEAAVVAETGSA